MGVAHGLDDVVPPLPADGHGAICGVVGHHDDAIRLPRLALEGVQRERQRGLLVVCGDEHRDAHGARLGEATHSVAPCAEHGASWACRQQCRNALERQGDHHHQHDCGDRRPEQIVSRGGIRHRDRGRADRHGAKRIGHVELLGDQAHEQGDKRGGEHDGGHQRNHEPPELWTEVERRWGRGGRRALAHLRIGHRRPSPRLRPVCRQ